MSNRFPASTYCIPAILFLTTIAIHVQSLNCPFFPDDHVYMTQKEGIESLAWPWQWAQGNSRPILYLTLALTYAVAGWDAWAFHLGNLLLHGINAVVLYGVVVTGLRMRFSDKDRAALCPSLTAAVVALVWSAHPVHVNVVGYVWQRGEALMAFFFLATLYASLRYFSDPSRRIWLLLSASACALGMMTKEVMVGAPLAVLLVDRAFSAGTFRNALRRHWPLHALHAATWILLAVMIRAGMEGFHSSHHLGFSSPFNRWYNYILAMPAVHLKYLQIALWPQTLCFDWNIPLRSSLSSAAPYILVSGALLAGVLWLLWKHPAWGTPAVIYLLLLAPTSSIMPMPDPLVEYRLYLPLAMLTTMAVCSVAWWLQSRKRLATVLVLVAILALSARTRLHYKTFSSGYALWRSTLRIRPDNWRAMKNTWATAQQEGRIQDMLREATQEVKTNPRPDSLLLLGQAALMENKPEEALSHLTRALEIPPPTAQVLIELGQAHEALHNYDLAETAYREALRIKPLHPDARLGIARAHLRRGEFDAVLQQCRKALEVWPKYPPTLILMGNVYLQKGNLDKALTCLESALDLDPDNISARLNLARIRHRMGDHAIAAKVYEQIIESNPEMLLARLEFGRVLESMSRTEEALEQYRRVLQQAPGHPVAEAAVKRLSPKNQ